MNSISSEYIEITITYCLEHSLVEKKENEYIS